MNLDTLIKDCTKPHSLLHTIGGIGIGLIIIGILPGLISQAFLLGIVVVLAAVLGEFLMGKRGKK